MKPPERHEYPSGNYTGRYINLVTGDALAVLTRQFTENERLFTSFSAGQWKHRYATDKWTVQELVGHMTDTERIMAYRALCISRGEAGSLPGFDENQYATMAQFNQLSSESMMEQYRTTRQATLALTRSFTEEMLSRTGTANGNPLSVRALVYIIAGHEQHHLGILREKYLVSHQS